MKLLRILKLVYNPRSRTLLPPPLPPPPPATPRLHALYSLTYIVERISYSSSSGQYGAYSIAYSIHARALSERRRLLHREPLTTYYEQSVHGAGRRIVPVSIHDLKYE